MKIMFGLFISFFVSSAMAESLCPNKMDISFGKITQSSTRDFDDLEAKTITLTKSKGVKVCYYSGASFNVRLDLSLATAFLNLSGYSRDTKTNYELTVNFPRNNLLSKKIEISKARIEMYYSYFDEDGCSFGQVPCESYPAPTGEMAVFGKIVIQVK